MKMAADNGYQGAWDALKKLGLNEVTACCVSVIDITQQHIAIVDSLRGGVVESLQRDKQPLEDVTADASLERNEYHKLELHQLDRIDDAEALYQIADRIMHGTGMKENRELGLGIMIEAARRGHAVALGVCFFHAQGIKMNEARGFELLRASAHRGHVSGSRKLALYFQTLFSQSFAAQYWLGDCYRYGNGADKNKQEAIRLYRAAALQGYARGQFWLGDCYQNGDGVEKNKLMSACLIKIAADNGYQRSSDRLSRLGLNRVMLADV
jgi:TPR repeat protein